MVASPLTTEILPGEVLFIPPGDKRPLLLLPETAATVNRPAPDFSTAAEPSAPPRRTPDEALRSCGTGTL